MRKFQIPRFSIPHAVLDLALFLLVMGGAVLLSLALAGVNDDNNPFALPVFLLAVVVVARTTAGYFWGIAASLAGTFCVNYMFTYPFWSFDISYPGYPLTFGVMLIVSVVVSALTTQIKRQERLRSQAEREAVRANLLRAIAHDIRTPLAAILGASSALLEQQLSPEDQRALLSGIHRDAQWLVRVSENLLTVTRVTGPDLALETEDEVLEEIIGSAVLKYRRSPEALPVEVDAPAQILVAPMDGVLMEQVLINLFDNVSSHARNASRIWVHFRREKGHVLLSVEDDGCGMAGARSLPFSGNRPRERSDVRRNMGIGLSVCQSIVHAHGGEMWIEKSAHGGAAVLFTLPCGTMEESDDWNDPDENFDY